MELSDEIIINAPKEKVYAALNDPEILQQCIPGCEELIKHSDTELEAKVVLKIGPVKAKFSGDVQLDTAGAPDAFSLTGQGNGGAAGHAKGGADVTLTADGPNKTRPLQGSDSAHTYTHPTQLTLLEHRLQPTPPLTGQDGPAAHCSMYPGE